MSNYDFFTQILWCNNLFKDKNQCIIFKNWIDGGFVYVKDLFDDHGEFVNEKILSAKLKDLSKDRRGQLVHIVYS